MAAKSIVFALANPTRGGPAGGRQHAAVVATGRSDQPNQINNVLAFPGVFRGMLDVSAEDFTEEMALGAAHGDRQRGRRGQDQSDGDRPQRLRRPT